MPPRRRTRLGPQIDVSRIARGLSRPGADTRHWVSYATVAAIDDDGKIDLSDPNAIVITPSSIDVDVVLEPSGYPMTCRYGQAAAGFFWCGPIKVGDQVLVTIPDGDSAMIGKIVEVISDPDGGGVPVGADGKPIFKNDRLLIFTKGVPIDLRSTDGQHTSTILANPDGSVVFNSGTSGVARKGDSTKLNMSDKDIQGLAVSLLSTGGFSPGGPPGPGTPIEFDGGTITGGSKTVLAGD